MVARQAQAAAEKSELSVETWALNLKSIAFSTVGDLFAEDGARIDIDKLPAHTQRAISSVEIAPDGTTKIKFWSKTAALETMAKHLGLFSLDNSQKKEDITVKVLMVG